MVCDTRDPKVVKEEDEKINRQCFSDAFYRLESHISFNKTTRHEVVPKRKDCKLYYMD